MHGNTALIRAVILLLLAMVIASTGVSIGSGAHGAIIWPYIALSVFWGALTLAYAIHLQRRPAFTNRKYTLFVLAIAMVALLGGLLLSVIPLSMMRIG